MPCHLHSSPTSLVRKPFTAPGQDLCQEVDASQGDLRTSDPESQEVREDSRAVGAEALLRGFPESQTSESQSLERLRTGQHGLNRTPVSCQAKG